MQEATITARYRLEGFFVLLFLSLNPISLSAQSHIRVDEGNSRLAIGPRESTLKLAITSDVVRDIPIHLEVEVLAADDSVIEQVAHDYTVTQKLRQLENPLKEAFSPNKNQDDPSSIWGRIRYRLIVTGSRQDPETGTIAVSELSTDPFVLKMGAPAHAKFDRTQAKIGETIFCTVKTERIGFRGYGMMLAEIGLPPGAEVDRASLDEAIQSATGAFIDMMSCLTG